MVITVRYMKEEWMDGWNNGRKKRIE